MELIRVLLMKIFLKHNCGIGIPILFLLVKKWLSQLRKIVSNLNSAFKVLWPNVFDISFAFLPNFSFEISFMRCSCEFQFSIIMTWHKSQPGEFIVRKKLRKRPIGSRNIVLIYSRKYLMLIKNARSFSMQNLLHSASRFFVIWHKTW